MKKYLLSCTMLLLEVAFFCALAMLYKIPANTIVKLVITLVLFLFVFEHYRVSSRLIWNEMKSLLKAMVCFFVVALVFVFKSQTLYQNLNITWIVVAVFILALFMNRTFRVVFRNQLAKRTLIIGTGADAERIGRIANNNRFALTKVIGYVQFKNESINKELINRHKKSMNGSKSFEIYRDVEIEKIVKEENIQQVIIATTFKDKEEVTDLLFRVQDQVADIKYTPEVDVTMTFNSQIQDFDGILLISTSHGKINVIGRFIKRLADILISLLGIILLIPIAIFIRYKNRKSGDYDPIIFTQNRIGLKGKSIKIYKFRTMVPNAEQVLEELMAKDPEIKKEYLTNKKLVNDPRITEVGKVLRKTSLDEFPQFTNVLKGEMSFVGPRPYLFREKEDMGKYYNSIIHCKPGITGMWQANGRSDVGFEERCKLDDYYYRNWTVGLDMVIIYKTVKSVFYGKGAL